MPFKESRIFFIFFFIETNLTDHMSILPNPSKCLVDSQRDHGHRCASFAAPHPTKIDVAIRRCVASEMDQRRAPLVLWKLRGRPKNLTAKAFHFPLPFHFRFHFPLPFHGYYSAFHFRFIFASTSGQNLEVQTTEGQFAQQMQPRCSGCIFCTMSKTYKRKS